MGQSPYRPHLCPWGVVVWWEPMHFFGSTKTLHCLSFSPESTWLFLRGFSTAAKAIEIRRGSVFTKPLVFCAIISTHALFSHPTGDNAGQRNPWGLATHSLPLCLVRTSL